MVVRAGVDVGRANFFPDQFEGAIGNRRAAFLLESVERVFFELFKQPCPANPNRI